MPPAAAFHGKRSTCAAGFPALDGGLSRRYATADLVPARFDAGRRDAARARRPAHRESHRRSAGRRDRARAHRADCSARVACCARSPKSPATPRRWRGSPRSSSPAVTTSFTTRGTRPSTRSGRATAGLVLADGELTGRAPCPRSAACRRSSCSTPASPRDCGAARSANARHAARPEHRQESEPRRNAAARRARALRRHALAGGRCLGQRLRDACSTASCCAAASAPRW